MSVPEANLPENIADAYADRSPGDATHQQHHDLLHAVVNALAGTGLDTEVAALFDDPDSLARTSASAAYVGGVTLPPANGVDDTMTLQAALDAHAGKRISGRAGEDYKISASLIIAPGTTLDMTGCTVTLIDGSNQNMIENAALTAVRSVTDAATTAGSTTVTSATAAFTAADVGRTVSVDGASGGTGGLGPLTANIVSVTDASTVEVSVAAQATTSAAAMSIFDRDSDITIIGGRWDRLNNSGGVEDLPNIKMRHVDGLTIRNVELAGVGAQGRAIFLGDITKFDGYDLDFDVSGVAMQINGPISQFRIKRVRATTSDDVIAFIGNDWPAYNVVAGDVTDLLVEDVEATGSTTAVKLITGEGFHADDVVIRRARGTVTQFVVWIGDDIAEATTTGGTYGRVTVEDVAGSMDGVGHGVVRVMVGDTDCISVSRARLLGGTAHNIAEVNVTTGKILTTLNLTDIGFTDLASRVAVNVAGSTGFAGTISTLNITRPHLTSSDAAPILLYVNGTTIDKVDVRDPDIRANGITGAGGWIRFRPTAAVGSLAVMGGYARAGGQLVHSGVTTTVHLGGGLHLDGVDRVVFANEGTPALTVVLGSVVFDTIPVNPFYLNVAGASVTILGGDETTIIGSVPLLGRSGTQTYRVNARRLSVPPSMVTHQLGDVFTASGGSVAAGHPVISNGAGVLKSLVDGSTWAA